MIRQKSEILFLAFSEQIHNVGIGTLPCLQSRWLTMTPKCGSWGQKYYGPSIIAPLQATYVSITVGDKQWRTYRIPSLRNSILYPPALLHHLGPSDSCLLYYVYICHCFLWQHQSTLTLLHHYGKYSSAYYRVLNK